MAKIIITVDTDTNEIKTTELSSSICGKNNNLDEQVPGCLNTNTNDPIVNVQLEKYITDKETGSGTIRIKNINKKDGIVFSNIESFFVNGATNGISLDGKILLLRGSQGLQLNSDKIQFRNNTGIIGNLCISKAVELGIIVPDLPNE